MGVDRRTFLKGCSAVALNITAAASVRAGSADEQRPVSGCGSYEPDRFLYGASAYPELQTRKQWLGMLDRFAAAHFTALRLAESSWGNLQTSLASFDFEWLHQALDDAHARDISVILGTATYIAPQWLIAQHPDMLRQLQPGVPVHSMGRKAACINHPAYREACRTYISMLAKTFREHPAVIGWQLDNEIEYTMGQVCYNPACEAAWQRWLARTYGTAAELNRRWDLTSWGMRIDRLSDVKQGVRDRGPGGHSATAHPGSGQLALPPRLHL